MRRRRARTGRTSPSARVMKCALTAAVLLWALSSAVSKETQRPVLVRLNVAALDAQGQPGGRADHADFQLFQDGKRQEIAFVHFTGGWAPQPKPGPLEYSDRAGAARHPTVVLIDLLSDRIMSDSLIGREVGDSLKDLESSDSLYLYVLGPAGDLYPVYPLPKPDTHLTPPAEPWRRNAAPLLPGSLEKPGGNKAYRGAGHQRSAST